MEDASPPRMELQLKSKGDMNHHHHHQRQNHQRHQIYNRNASARGGDSQITLQPGQVIFRLLCHVNTAGGVIGNSGSIIKQLENQTGSKIRFEEPLPNCHERVINVIGDSAIDKRIPIDAEDCGSQNEDSKVKVSRAQEGLMRVFERVLEVEGNDNGVTGCRLLAGSGQIGAVMGKGGKIVDAIRRHSGAKIRVLKKEQIPACATPEEELIQIMGSVIAVKKALVAVSCRLQDCTPGERLHMSSYVALNDVQLDFIPNNNQTSLPEKTGDHTSIGNTLSADIDKVLCLDEGDNQRKVVLRLLCSSGSAGGIIGKGATIVKSLEKETGASIKFSSPVAGMKERVATISSLESPDPLYSSAQIATVRVFARSIEVGINQGLIPGSSEEETVTARILVAPNEVDCLVDNGGKVASHISAASGKVEIQLLGANLVPHCASDNDKVVQIVGEYENVKSALFQVTGRLRDKVFSSLLAEGAGSTHYSYSAVPDSSPFGRGMTSSLQPDHVSNLSSVNQINWLGSVHKVDGSHSPVLQSKQLKDIGKNAKGSAMELKASRGVPEHQSASVDSLIIRTVEVLVPGKLFGSVYGENGSNLARLKEISGATVILRDPSPGEPNGKVIISGTPERIQMAQSLLQAFI